MTKVYSSDLTQDQYELIKPLISPAKPGGRPREVCMLSVLNAIFYLVTQGCKWRDLPGGFPAWQRVYTYFLHWRLLGTTLLGIYYTVGPALLPVVRSALLRQFLIAKVLLPIQ